MSLKESHGHESPLSPLSHPGSQRVPSSLTSLTTWLVLPTEQGSNSAAPCIWGYARPLGQVMADAFLKKDLPGPGSEPFYSISSPKVIPKDLKNNAKMRCEFSGNSFNSRNHYQDCLEIATDSSERQAAIPSAVW